MKSLLPRQVPIGIADQQSYTSVPANSNAVTEQGFFSRWWFVLGGGVVWGEGQDNGGLKSMGQRPSVNERVVYTRGHENNHRRAAGKQSG